MGRTPRGDDVLERGVRYRTEYRRVRTSPDAKRTASVAIMYITMYSKRMSRRYSIAEARSHLAEIVDQAEEGRAVELTRRGEPVVVVVSRGEFDRLQGKRRHFGDAYRKFLQIYSVEEIGVEEDFSGTARDQTIGRRVSL
jgi:prevent-host-death family protein